MRGSRLSLVPVALLLGCRAAPPASDTGAAASAETRASATPPVVEVPPRERPPMRRGLGSLKARVPGTNDMVGNVTLVSHKVTAVVRDGFARTEIEEVFRNDNDRVLEGIFTFALPASGAITRLALDVDGKLVEGELEEQKRAAGIFRGIVDDTVRPRDPALLQQRGGKVELKIFPMPAKGTRRVIVAYDEVLTERDGKGTYTLPLSSGKERETKIDDVLASVSIEGATAVTSDDTVSAGADGARRVVREARDVAPQSDVVVKYERAPTRVSAYTPKPGDAGAAKGETASGFVTARLQLPEAPATATSGPRVFVVDVGHGQPAEALVDAWDIIDATLARAPEGSEFAVLACDSACASYPASGLATTSAVTRSAFAKWSADVATAGASDVAGMLADGARRATEGGTLVLLGRGTATTGELAPSAIVSRVKATSKVPEIVHVVGVGPFADEPALRSIAQGLGGSVARARGGDASAHATRLLAPIVRSPKLSLPSGLSLVAPDPLPSLVAGDEVVVSARASADAQGEIVVEGTLSGAPVRVTAALDRARTTTNPLLEKLWARDRISSLVALGNPALDKEIVKLSKSYHVLSPKTAFIVLENEAMFASFGIQRTSKRAEDQADHAFGTSGHAAGGVAPGAAQGFGAGAALPQGTLDGLGASGPGTADFSGTGGAAAPRGADLGGLSGISGGRAASVGRGTAQIRIGAMTVNGGLPREVIQRIVRQNFGRLRNCADRGLQMNPDAVGTVTLQLVISPQGAVMSTTASSASGVSQQTAQCMASALRALSFPESERGPVQASFPITVTIDDRPRQPPQSQLMFQTPTPTVTVAVGGDAWMTGGDDEIAKVTQARDQAPEKRRGHEALMLALSRRGRDAITAGRAWALADPDEARAHGFLAEALSRAGSDAEAARELGIVASLDPTSHSAQLAAARAYRSAGDAIRACAHLRAAALAPEATEPVRVEALRCRIDVMGDTAARDEARSLAEKMPQMKPIADGAAATALELGVASALKFDLKCETCPSIVIIAPNGRVLGASAPSKSIASKHHVESALSMSGTFRVIFTGTPPTNAVDVVVTTMNGPQTLKVPASTRTLAAVTVELPPAGFGIGLGRIGTGG